MNLRLLCCCLLLAQMAYARILTVSNDPLKPAMYATLQEAHDAAAAGDSIYLLPSPDPYAPARLSKQVSLFGIGFLPDRENAYVSRIKGTLTLDNSAALKGSLITGLVVTSIVSSGPPVAGALGDLTITRNYIEQLLELPEGSEAAPVSNINITNNYLHKLVAGAHSYTFLIANNLFWAVTADDYLTMADHHTSGFHIINNVFAGPPQVSPNEGIRRGVGATIEHNIFYGLKPFWLKEMPKSSIIRNNLAFRQGTPYAADPFVVDASNTASGNQYNKDPRFVKLDLSRNTFDRAPFQHNDLRLQAASPGAKAGLDGTDLGAYGGAAAYHFALADMPMLPYISRMQLGATLVPAGGTLEVTIESKQHQ